MPEPGSCAFIVYANVPKVKDQRICPICDEPAPQNEVKKDSKIRQSPRLRCSLNWERLGKASDSLASNGYISHCWVSHGKVKPRLFSDSLASNGYISDCWVNHVYVGLIAKLEQLNK
jgi:hypothetical protein